MPSTDHEDRQLVTGWRPARAAFKETLAFVDARVHARSNQLAQKLETRLSAFAPLRDLASRRPEVGAQ